MTAVKPGDFTVLPSQLNSSPFTLKRTDVCIYLQSGLIYKRKNKSLFSGCEPLYITLDSEALYNSINQTGKTCLLYKRKIKLLISGSEPFYIALGSDALCNFITPKEKACPLADCSALPGKDTVDSCSRTVDVRKLQIHLSLRNQFPIVVVL